MLLVTLGGADLRFFQKQSTPAFLISVPIVIKINRWQIKVILWITIYHFLTYWPISDGWSFRELVSDQLTESFLIGWSYCLIGPIITVLSSYWLNHNHLYSTIFITSFWLTDSVSFIKLFYSTVWLGLSLMFCFLIGWIIYTLLSYLLGRFFSLFWLAKPCTVY